MYLKSTTKLVMVLNTKLWVTLSFAVRYSCIPLPQNSKSYTVFKGSPFEKIKNFGHIFDSSSDENNSSGVWPVKGLYLRIFLADRGRHLDRDFRGSCESRLILYKFTFYWLIGSIKLFSPLI